MLSTTSVAVNNILDFIRKDSYYANINIYFRLTIYKTIYCYLFLKIIFNYRVILSFFKINWPRSGVKYQENKICKFERLAHDLLPSVLQMYVVDAQRHVT